MLAKPHKEPFRTHRLLFIAMDESEEPAGGNVQNFSRRASGKRSNAAVSFQRQVPRFLQGYEHLMGSTQGGLQQPTEARSNHCVHSKSSGNN